MFFVKFLEKYYIRVLNLRLYVVFNDVIFPSPLHNQTLRLSLWSARQLS